MNDNCLAGYRCPKCGSEGPFDIETEDFTEWHDDGTWEQWEPSFQAGGVWHCKKCKFDGDEEHFRKGFIEWLASRIKKDDSGIIDALDEMVHELKSKEASEINNSGLEAQIAYLIEGSDPVNVVADLTEAGMLDEEGGGNDCQTLDRGKERIM